ncbi:MAG: F0F1 ATP synthase subunit delta [Pseudomonadota bacterium]
MAVDQAPDRTIVTGLAGRYATALFALSKEGGTIDAVADELTGLTSHSQGDADLALLISSPRIERAQKVKAILAVAKDAGVSDLTSNFLGTLAANGRLGSLPAVADAYQKILAHHRGETSADVVSATALSDSQMDALRSKLRAAMGRDVAVNVTIDESLLGGLIVKVGSKMIDSSLKTKINRLEIAMKGAG